MCLWVQLFFSCEHDRLYNDEAMCAFAGASTVTWEQDKLYDDEVMCVFAGAIIFTCKHDRLLDDEVMGVFAGAIIFTYEQVRLCDDEVMCACLQVQALSHVSKTNCVMTKQCVCCRCRLCFV